LKEKSYTNNNNNNNNNDNDNNNSNNSNNIIIEFIKLKSIKYFWPYVKVRKTLTIKNKL